MSLEPVIALGQHAARPAARRRSTQARLRPFVDSAHLLETLESRLLLSAGSSGAVLSTLLTFNYTNGTHPQGALIADGSGNLYGTTTTGGANSLGTVFKLDAGTHALTTLVTFNKTNGNYPYAGLVIDPSGNLYGTTYGGGANTLTDDPFGQGTVFEVAATTHAFSILASFDVTHGNGPQAGLIIDADGNLFGTTRYGGANNLGTVFEVAAGTHVLSTLATFDGVNGASPQGDLIADASGNLFGTTSHGGANDKGIVFEVAAGTHALSTLATFDYTNSGAYPQAGLIADAAGNLYGTTTAAGPTGFGTIFQVAAGTHALTTLATFDSTNGNSPNADLIADPHGNLYGTTSAGGANNKGTVFAMAADTHQLTTLASFNTTNGERPFAPLLADASGNLYGTTYDGGADGYGIVFMLHTPTITSLSAAEADPGPHHALTLTANVSAVRGTPTGTVTFYEGSTPLGTSPVANGVATLTTAALSLGTHTFTAAYSGDSTYATSVSASLSELISAGTHLVVTGPDAGSEPLVKVFDAATGDFKFSFYAYDRGFRGAVRVAMADFNSDGVPDIITSTGPGGLPLVNVFDGNGGVLLGNFYAYDPGFIGGVEVSVADVTGSGHPAIVTGTDPGGVPLVNVFNSIGTLLLNFWAYDSHYIGGVRIAAGDFRHDGKAEIVTSTGAGGLPLVNVFNWVGTLQGNFWGDTASYTGGLQIAVGDFTGDRVAKVATLRDSNSSPQIQLYDLSTQSQFRTFTLADSTLPMNLRLAATDANDDGIDDIITVNGSGNGPQMEIFNGLDGSSIRKITAYDSTLTTGLFVAAG